MKNFIFWVGTTIGGVQYPHELIRYCPPIYVLCVSSHLWAVPSQTFWATDDFLSDFWWFCWLGLGNPCHIATKTPFEKLNQNLGLADPHPPHLDIVPSLSQVWPPFSCPFFRGSNKLLNWWDIAPPFMYYVFHHIYGQFQGKLSFGQFW